LGTIGNLTVRGVQQGYLKVKSTYEQWCPLCCLLHGHIGPYRNSNELLI